MATRYFLGIDMGSSGLRCLILDLEGNIAGFAERPYTCHTPPELAPLGKEFDAEELWSLLCQVIQEATGGAGIDAGDVAGVACASQREGLALLDRKGRELYVGPNTDLRAFFEGMSLDADLGREIYDITGHIPSFMFAPAKLKWFQTNRPEVYDSIACVMSLSDWATYRLCGERIAERCAAAEIGLLDFRSGERSTRLAGLLGLPRDIYPPLGNAGERAGRVSSEAAAQTGIPQGTAVALAGADSQCGLLGMGAVREGEAGIMAGWSATLQMVTGRPVSDGEGRTWSGCHALPGHWIVESHAGEAGGSLAWLKDTLFSGEEDAFVVMDSLAQGIGPGAEGVLAFIGPQAMNMSRVGPSLGGFLLPVPPRAVCDIGRAHLVRATLENLCFAFKASLQQLREVSGVEPGYIGLGGGLSRSKTLAEILASVLDRPVFVAATPQVTGVGCALCAATGAGVFPSLEAAVDSLSPRPVTVEPDPSASAEYPDYYLRWRGAWQSLSEMGSNLL